MSWWIGVEIDTGGEEPDSLAERNVTYNAAPMFIAAFAIPAPGTHAPGCRCLLGADEHERGLRALHGTSCTEAAGAIAAALERMTAEPEKYRAMNGGGSYDSAREDLAWLLAQCAAHPKGQVYVH